MSVLILGYYNRKNLGDDLFKYVFLNKFSNYNLIFLNPDDIQVVPDNVQVVIVGGGDLINDYYMPKIRKLVADLDVPVYAIGVGFPYPDLCTPEYVDIFDIIITRTKYAYDKLKDKVQIYYEPDLVFMESPVITNGERNKIGVFFANSICGIDSPLINNLVEIVKYLANLKRGKYIVELYPMNTSGSPNEDDYLLNWRIYQRVNMKNVVCIKNFNIGDIPRAFNSFKFTVCTRFHAHILSLLYSVPFVSLHSTSKVDDLIRNYEYDLNGEGGCFGRIEYSDIQHYSVPMKVDIKLRPIDIDVKTVISKIDDIRKFPPIRRLNTSSLYWGITNLLLNRPAYGKKLTNRIYKTALQYIGKSKDPEYISKCVTFAISRKTSMDYTWGLRENISKENYDLRAGIEWILNSLPRKFADYNNTTPLVNRKYNYRYFDGELDNTIHRSGWSYVVNNLYNYQNPNGILFDTYCDKTYGWDREFLTNAGILPVKREWVGIFHHTFNDLYSNNNLLNIVNQPVFRESLKYCKYLIVLSDYLRTQLRTYVDVPIHVLYHPTEFTERKWIQGDKLLQVGAWLRNTYAIYSLPHIDLPRYALRGKYMENYYPTANFIEELLQLCKSKYIMEGDICRENNYALNKWILGMIEDVNTRINNVTIIDKCSNDEYDSLLQNSIIFLNLVDASACNTIIECAVRQTPVIVNRIPPVVEYLGVDYPLYYDNLYEVPELLNAKNIKKANRYLQKLDTTKLQISTFMEGLLKL